MKGMHADVGTGLIRDVFVGGFRSAHEVAIAPGMVCALVGEAQTGKSNLLAAIRAVLDSSVELVPADAPRDGDGSLLVRARLRSGSEFELRGPPAAAMRRSAVPAPTVLFLPAADRTGTVVAETRAATPPAARALEIFRAALDEDGEGGRGDSTPARSVVNAVQACCAAGVSGVVMLIEEPELYLRPQAQRYLYRLLRRFAAEGNQVIYSTHSPAFLNVARLDELVFVARRADEGTRALQPEPVSPDQDFRILSEFDAERAELFLAHAAVLVEGQTEKLAFPFVFESLGHDADRAGISIVECGGKWNIPLFARVCSAAGIPAVAVFDSDARPGKRPSAANRAVAAEISAHVGADRTIELAPDFEAVAGIDHHRNGKPERAWRIFASLPADQMPRALVRAAELALELARAEISVRGTRAPERGPCP